MKVENWKQASALAVAFVAVLAVGGESARAVNIPVSAAGVSTTSTNADWVTDGLATLNGGTSGVDWTVAGRHEGVNSDWVYVAGGSQGNLGASPTVEWEDNNGVGQKAFGYTFSTTTLSAGALLGSGALNAGGYLVISEVAPAAGDYTLNDVTQTATAVGQILQWTAPASSITAGDTMSFSGTAVIGPNTVFSGPIGFSGSSVPEPASLGLLALGGLGLLTRRRR